MLASKRLLAGVKKSSNVLLLVILGASLIALVSSITTHIMSLFQIDTPVYLAAIHFYGVFWLAFPLALVAYDAGIRDKEGNDQALIWAKIPRWMYRLLGVLVCYALLMWFAPALGFGDSLFNAKRPNSAHGPLFYFAIFSFAFGLCRFKRDKHPSTNLQRSSSRAANE